MTTLLVATTNAGKRAELAALLQPLGFTVEDLSAWPDVPEAVEDGLTFAENARLKARHYAAATGRAVLADDSGLAVDALTGDPGVRSARYAGEPCDDTRNLALLVERMADDPDRRARFVCALCLIREDGSVLETEGRCEGTLLDAPRGEGGFGYDPLFVPDDTRAHGRSFAEMTRDEKAAFSHRGRALASLGKRLHDELPESLTP